MHSIFNRCLMKKRQKNASGVQKSNRMRCAIYLIRKEFLPNSMNFYKNSPYKTRAKLGSKPPTTNQNNW